MYKCVLACLVILGFCIADSVHARCRDISKEVFYNKTCTKIETYKSKHLSEHPILLVALHGDTAPWDKSASQYDFAERVAKKSVNLIAVGMLRPGYIDSTGRTSDGLQGEGIGDNYDEPRVSQIAGAIRYLKHYHQASRVILAGQSGGAATAANLIALHPDLVDHAFLMACPCDINAWRKNMLELTKKPVFKGDLAKTSPIDRVERISNQTTITIVVGRDDLITPPSLNEAYQSALIKAGKNVILKIIEGDHEIFLNPEVLNEVASVVNGYAKH